MHYEEFFFYLAVALYFIDILKHFKIKTYHIKEKKYLFIWPLMKISALFFVSTRGQHSSCNSQFERIVVLGKPVTVLFCI